MWLCVISTRRMHLPSSLYSICASLFLLGSLILFKEGADALTIDLPFCECHTLCECLECFLKVCLNLSDRVRSPFIMAIIQTCKKCGVN